MLRDGRMLGVWCCVKAMPYTFRFGQRRRLSAVHLCAYVRWDMCVGRLVGGEQEDARSGPRVGRVKPGSPVFQLTVRRACTVLFSMCGVWPFFGGGVCVVVAVRLWRSHVDTCRRRLRRRSPPHIRSQCKSQSSIRPVLKHGPRSLTYARVIGC